MKRFALILSILAVFQLTGKAQETCDELPALAQQYLEPSKGDKSVFISDGQVYRAFLDDEQQAEFQATLYGGSIYRIATSAGSSDNYVIFEIWDKENNLLFTNEEYSNAPYWDFDVASTIDCRIVTKLDVDKKGSGCSIMLIGFKQ